MPTCHVCRRAWNDHAADCRVREDIERLARVHDRLVAEGRQADLADRIVRYLDLFGHHPCQQRDGLPVDTDCQACGNADICVILPPTAPPGAKPS